MKCDAKRPSRMLRVGRDHVRTNLRSVLRHARLDSNTDNQTSRSLDISKIPRQTQSVATPRWDKHRERTKQIQFQARQHLSTCSLHF